MMDPQVTYRNVLHETHEFYRENHAGLGDQGYSVIYGPLVPKPPVLFVGYQPGGVHKSDQHLWAAPTETPPPESYYASEEWRLAVNMRSMWPRQILANSTGLNAVFFRSPDVDNFHALGRDTFRRAVAFSLPRAARLIDALDPVAIVAIGFGTLRLFGKAKPVLRSKRGRALVCEGMIAGRQALATLHLSGAQISTQDRQAIACFVEQSWSGSTN